MPPDALGPDPRNPRKHSKKQIRQIADSIAAFGFVVPALVDRELRVIAGHGRVLAAETLGLDEVPVVRLEHLSRAQARAFAIADNRLTENAVWDDRLLAEAFKELSVLDLDFRLDVTGFEMAEIDLKIEGLGTSVEEDEADAVPVVEEGPAVSNLGDLWVLDGHRLYCGSALDEAGYITLMAGEQAAMVFSDPPYNVPIDGNVSGLGSVRHREFAMASGEMTRAQFTRFLTAACTLMARHSTDGAIHYLCMDWRHVGELLAAGSAIYSELKNICVWVKHNAGMGSFYRSQHELILVFKHGCGAHQNNVQLGRHGRNRTNVWNYAGANTFGRSGREGNLLAMHPTVKPVALIADAILDASGRGDVVLDAFAGSGSTIVAAERTGRRSFGIELDPHYVDVAIRRWQKLTGKFARHAVSGWRFDDVAAETEARHG
jgi:16S rRNA G966 N2-methylase RsmD